MGFNFGARAALNVIIIVFVLLIVAQLYSAQLGKSPNQLEECKTLKFNGRESVGIVFFSSGEKAKTYANFLETISPFDEYPDAFSFYYIDDYKPDCKLYKGVASLCHSRALLEKASSCDYDYVTVLDDQAMKIRSSSYQSVMSINIRHPLTVLAHEFGHAFLGLAEEYTGATLPRNPLNCKSTCEGFVGEKDGCYEGCSRDDYYRTIENGIMRTLSSKDFGIFNENLFRKKIEKETGKSITGNVINGEVDCSEEKYYLIEGYYDQEYFGSIVIDKSLEVGCVGGNGVGDGKYEIYTDSGLVSSGEFAPEMLFTDAPGEEEIEGETYDYEGTFVLKVPYVDGSETLVITDERGTTEVELRESIVDSEQIYNDDVVQELAVRDLVEQKKEEVEIFIAEKKEEIEAAIEGSDDLTKEEAIKNEIIATKKKEIEFVIESKQEELVQEAIAKNLEGSGKIVRASGEVFGAENENELKQDNENELTTADVKITVQAIREFSSIDKIAKLKALLILMVLVLLVSTFLHDLRRR